MGHKQYCVISGAVFSLVALAHLIRMVYGMSVQIDEYAVPMSVSWVAFIVTAALAVWAFRTGRQTQIS
jgi:lipopolysaccharide export LptBFGC system permease protein LptF